ncbi:MAG: 4Fe-4S dicluster domain-containing protein [Deltaproteobacteria bacterium]|nr:4Fe-4S dicluster domain-containing protein [Deltaproteobacteria bacterium]
MQPKYAMVIDASQCFYCKACIIACQLENEVPPHSYRNWIKSEDGSSRQLHFQPGNCMQCDKPSCVAACPVPGATFKSNDGLVLIDRKVCINCGNCVPACPYGARYRHPAKHIADKCDFCRHRIKRGLEPACVEVCPTRTRVFGDLNDPSSQVNRLLKQGGLVRVINAKVDTQPTIYYKEGTVPLTWPAEPTLPGNVRMSPSFWKKIRTA